MHPRAPSCTTALVPQTDVARQRRRGGPFHARTSTRVIVVAAALTGVSAGVLWLKRENPHPIAVDAIREGPLVEAQSLSPVLETSPPSDLVATPARRLPPAPTRTGTQVNEAIPATEVARPAWLLADDVATIGELKQQLRAHGARQMGASVRFAMLNLAELLALKGATAGSATAATTAHENQMSALLFTFYLCHLDRAGDGAGVKAFLRSVANGMPQEQAVKTFLLAGRETTEFEREMGMAFAGVGVELQFTRRGGAAFKP